MVPAKLWLCKVWVCVSQVCKGMEEMPPEFMGMFLLKIKKSEHDFSIITHSKPDEAKGVALNESKGRIGLNVFGRIWEVFGRTLKKFRNQKLLKNS